MATLDDLIAVEHEKRALAEKLLETDQKATLLASALEKEQSEVRAARAAVAAAQAVCHEKEAMVVELRSRVEETKAKLASLEELPKTVAETRQALQQQQQQCVEKEAVVAGLQARLNEAQAQLSALEGLPRNVQESAAALAAAQAVCAERERVVASLQGQLETTKANISSLEVLPQCVAEAQQALAASQALCMEKEGMVGHLREQVQEQRVRLGVLEREVPLELEKSHTALATAQAMCGEKDRQVEGLRERLAAGEARVAELEKVPRMLQEAREELGVVLARGEEKKRALMEVQQQLSILEARLAVLLEEREQQQEEMEALRLQQQQQPSPVKEKEVVEMQVEVPSPETLRKLAAAEANCAEKEEEIESLEERLAHAQTKLARLEKMPQEVEKAREALVASEARCAEAGQLLDTLQEQLEEHMSRVAALEEENASLLAAQSKLEGQVREAQSQAREAIKEAAASAATAAAATTTAAPAAPVDLGSLLSESQRTFLNGAQARVSELEKLLVDRQAKADSARARLEGEAEAQRVERRALEEALNMFFLAGGLRGLASRELATTNAGREDAMEARAEALRVLVEERRMAQEEAREGKHALMSKDREWGVVQARLREREVEVVVLQQQLVVEQEAVASLSTALEKKEGELRGWKEQVQVKRKEGKASENEEMQTLISRLEKEEAEVCQLDGLVQEKEKEIAGLQRALREKEGARQALLAKVEEGEGEMEGMRQKWEAAEREARNLRRAREEVERQVEGLGDSLASKEKECDGLRGRLAAQAEDRAALESLQDAQVQVKALTATLEKKNAEMGSLKERLLAAEEAGAVAREEVAGQVEGLQMTVQEKEHELNGLMDRLMAAQEYREEMQGKLERVTEEKAKAEAVAAKLKEEEKERNENVQRLLQDKEQADEKLREFEQEQEAAAAAVRQAEEEKAAVAAEAQSAQQYVVQLEAKCEALHGEVEKEGREKQRLESVNETLTTQMQEKEKEVEALARKLVLAKDLAASLEEELHVKSAALSRDLMLENNSSGHHSHRPQTRSSTAAAAAGSSSSSRGVEAQVEEQRRRMSSLLHEQRHTLEGHAAELSRERELREAMELHMLDARDAAQALEADKVRLINEVEEYKRKATQLEKQNGETTKSLGRMEEDCERADMVRKTLHNQLVELKGNIQVFVRVRPPLPGAGEGKVKCLPFKFVDSGVGVGPAGERYCRALELTPMEDEEGFEGGRGGGGKRFVYDQVFTPRASQEAVFAEVLPLVQSALDGYKVCIFAYGQTNSGKTYTMLGPNGGRTTTTSSSSSSSSRAMLQEERGIIYRTVEHVFGAVAALRKHGWRFGLSVEMVEIYNEKLRDLLSPEVEEGGGDYDFERSEGGNGKGVFAASSSSSGGCGMGKGGGRKRSSKRGGLEVRHCFGGEGGREGEAVPGLTCLPVHSASEVTVLVSQALARRCVKRTRSNADSSRSHVVFTLKIEAESSRGIVRHGCLHLIDLAGSERMKKSGSNAHPELLKEAQSINKSLSVLGNVMTALGKREKHVPFRESALTSLLRHSLGGDCKALMVCNLSPAASSLSESVLSLRFAQKVNAVVTHKK